MDHDTTHLNIPSFSGEKRQSARLLLLTLATLVATLLLQGCASKGDRLAVGDGIPPDIARIPDAVPKVEPLAKSGNPESYVVKGQRYRTLRNRRGYVERGLASWYGPYFHGRKTSSGEIYDMRAMSAAHKTLPLPTYAKVTNLENGRSVVIRVNDRGPFHGPRLIDLSYTAAVKLGVYRKGTAMVEVRAIDPGGSSSGSSLFLADRSDTDRKAVSGSSARSTAKASGPRRAASAPVAGKPEVTGVADDSGDTPKATRSAYKRDHTATLPMISATGSPSARETLAPAIASRSVTSRGTEALYLQIGAFGDPKNAERLRSRVKGQLASSQVRILDPDTTGSALYKVRVGPLGSESDANRVTQQIAALGLERPEIIRD